jgi:hypothetical protein
MPDNQNESALEEHERLLRGDLVLERRLKAIRRRKDALARASQTFFTALRALLLTLPKQAGAALSALAWVGGLARV